MDHYCLHFDGSCGPKNPSGMAAYGFVLTRQGETLRSGHGEIGTGLGNNYAEFTALDKGLCAFISVHDTTSVHHLQVYGDSNLVVQIMNRRWKASPDKLYWPAYEWAVGNLKIIRQRGHRVSFDWIPRAQNQRCDDLSKLDAKGAA